MKPGPQDAAMCEGMWRFGRLLVCHREAYFPDRCVKSNDPVGSRRVKITLKWHHPFLYLLGRSLAHATVSKSQAVVVTLHVGLCSRCRQRYKRMQIVLIAWLGTSLAALLLGVFWATAISGYLELGGGLGLVSGYFVDRWFGRILTVKEINSRYVWLRGASAAFLAELPEWPGGKSR